jgi:predicted methyltransferase
MFRAIHRWLKPGGVLLISVEGGDEPAVTGDWLGAPMYYSHFDEETTTRLVRAAGFTVVKRP